MYLLHREAYYVWLGRRIGLTKIQTSTALKLQRSLVQHYWSSVPPKSARDTLIEEFKCGGIPAVLEAEAIESVYLRVQQGFYRHRTIQDIELDIDRECTRVLDAVDARLQGVSLKCLQKIANARQKLSK
ncbi:hypothetical protein [Vibrio vulnificus]|uniref:hypothetical protein n=1 Tax=Vibrio vulnificus TaxID=672 RepID=UPI002878C344|nr:hypothetical protein [Vibrio vulnificus]MDS1873011.1 hypothetical protein [Vibrio vulnificus]